MRPKLTLEPAPWSPPAREVRTDVRLYDTPTIVLDMVGRWSELTCTLRVYAVWTNDPHGIIVRAKNRGASPAVLTITDWQTLDWQSIGGNMVEATFSVSNHPCDGWSVSLVPGGELPPRAAVGTLVAEARGADDGVGQLVAEKAGELADARALPQYQAALMGWDANEGKLRPVAVDGDGKIATTGGGGGGLSAIATDTALANFSGVSAVPTAQPAVATATATSIVKRDANADTAVRWLFLARLVATTVLGLVFDTLRWIEGQTPTITQEARTTDAAPSDFTIQAGGVFATATTNKTGASLVLGPGAGKGNSFGGGASGLTKVWLGHAGDTAGDTTYLPGLGLYSGTGLGALTRRGWLTAINSTGGLRLYGDVSLSLAAVGAVDIASGGNSTYAVTGTLGITASSTVSLTGPTVNVASASAGTWYGPSVSIGLSAVAERFVIDDNGTKARLRGYGSANTLGLTIETDASDTNLTTVGTCDITTGGNCTLAVTGTYDVTTSGAITVTNASGSLLFTSFAQVSFVAQNDAMRLFGLDIRLYPTNKALDHYDTGTGLRPWRQVFPTQLQPGSNALTTLTTASVEANTAGYFDGFLIARNGATNSKVWRITFAWNADATTVTIRDFTATALGATQGTIGTTISAAAPSGLTFAIQGTTGSGIRHALRGSYYADA